MKIKYNVMFIKEMIQNILAGIICVFLIISGIVFIVTLTPLLIKTFSTYGWIKTECTIEESWIEGIRQEENKEISIKVRYHYQWKDKSYTSQQFSIRKLSYSDIPTASKTHIEYTPGAWRDCYVNPDNPSEAVLKKDPAWIFIFFSLGLIFGVFLSAAGGIMVYSIFKH